MNRFQKKDKEFPFLGKFLSVLIFCIVLFLFFSGISSVSRLTAQKEAESLKNSIVQSAVHCYALEGFYPDRLDYLEEHYGIQYDKSKYIVSYEVVGSNLMPDISVIPLKAKGGPVP